MTLQWLLSDWNLAFAVPLVLALVYLGLYVVSGVTFGEPDVDADVDAGADVDADADAGAEHHGGQVDLHPDHDPHGPVPAHFTVLSWFGVGRVPLSLLLAAALLGWGGVGLGAAAAGRTAGRSPAVAVAAAALGAVATARAVTFLLTRVVPVNETYARRRHELLGSEGEAIYAIDETFGMAGVRDDRGELFQVGCRADPKLIGPIAKGSRVKLVAYNKDTNLFTVVPATAAHPAGSGAAGSVA